MFDSLTERLQGVFKTLRGHGRITEATLDASLREIRMALLEADVHVRVVKDLIAAVREKALGQEVLRSLSPGQQVVKIVRDELEGLLGAGSEPAGRIDTGGKPPAVVMLVGLQGSGKTTSTAKLGRLLKKQGRYPFLVPADVYRPAAIEQLLTLARQNDLKAYEHDGTSTPGDIVRAGIAEARKSGFDTVLVDTAGRLHIDAELMDELKALKANHAPREILFVADAMTGQDAVRSAGEFHTALGLTGTVLTKLDGDARGGAALSIRHVTGVPIRFVGVGEKADEFEPFHPDRMVSRILGMGDVLTLIEKAEEVVDEKEAEQLQKKMLKDELTLDDFRKQLKMVGKMGPLSGIVGMLPGMSHVKEQDLDTGAITRVVAIIDSMTPDERRKPKVLNASRKKRIARGSGQSVPEINRLLKQFAMMRRMMKNLKKQGQKG
ncbi:MAG: signal recognition particle protein, partial [Planctomycetota bacterium]|nr:signal recognition particle protein [Planctomycetota bacterium]